MKHTHTETFDFQGQKIRAKITLPHKVLNSKPVGLIVEADGLLGVQVEEFYDFVKSIIVAREQG